MASYLSYFDIFDKTKDKELVISDKFSFILSDIVSVFTAFLLLANIIIILSPKIHRDLAPLQSIRSGDSLVNISLGILVDLPCYYLHFDLTDSLGFTQNYVNNTLRFYRYDFNYSLIGLTNQTMVDKCYPCFKVQFHNYTCCNGCDRLKENYKLNNLTPEPEKWPQCQTNARPDINSSEKCLVKGKVSVNRVRGSFHIAAGRNIYLNDGSHIHELLDDFPNLAFSHAIEHIRFGPRIITAKQPLQNLVMRAKENLTVTHDYSLLVTPVIFVADNQFIEKSFEYTVYLHPVQDKDPGIYFDYQFTPYTIQITWISRSFRGFLISTAGFTAGLYAIASIIDQLFHSFFPPKANTTK
ncbi:hypothetical protein TVAG_369150 [Trichomonas vaginalis G3]|uniref:Endoplasmic reticulum vesicle transporter C-terminal domain-containing protein n=1 Tax=Trichomonas vaginalis (strain ATCC PRA-98 / G3) TaxID=412133 RepID=A2FGE1_TRIV3|nr:vesicle-mediated transport [Trichomonas vaginalis G3]XP_051103735.1 vesicle-mediated transport [Trichomonas vaginalis G3]EAX96005.1 hypothetical protein TVAG_369150 [Trichomonas vaginalis G3]KAI5483330.1 vesicle-mediated transport [Trichomonas vaginalis G3]KAI5537112.1 vesicle-mediated transport [Trichomonas vaginalis G3]|eukprot:XP_001308935.1 hypothetical protein [Trichomonas vaginalis G3]